MQEDRIRLRCVSTAFRSSGCSERNSSRVVYRKMNNIFNICVSSHTAKKSYSKLPLFMHINICHHLPLLLVLVTAVSPLFYSSVQELHLLPWTQTPPVSHSALCSAAVPLPTSLPTSVVVGVPGVPVRREGH